VPSSKIRTEIFTAAENKGFNVAWKLPRHESNRKCLGNNEGKTATNEDNE
jgi:hypothetical protein